MLDAEFDKLAAASPDDEEHQFGMDFFGAADGDVKQAMQDVIADYEAKGIY
jgi:hypothetical protein